MDARCDAVGSEERPLFGKLPEGRRSRERGGAPLYKRQTDAGLAVSDALSALSVSPPKGSVCVSPWFSALFPSLVPALVARRGLLVGDADGRRRSAACGGPARPDEESAGEASPATKGRSFLLFLLLYAWCGAVCK